MPPALPKPCARCHAPSPPPAHADHEPSPNTLCTFNVRGLGMWEWYFCTDCARVVTHTVLHVVRAPLEVLEAEVHAALGRALDNGYFADATEADAEAIAADLCEHDQTFEGHDVKQLMPAVLAWLRARAPAAHPEPEPHATCEQCGRLTLRTDGRCAYHPHERADKKVESP